MAAMHCPISNSSLSTSSPPYGSYSTDRQLVSDSLHQTRSSYLANKNDQLHVQQQQSQQPQHQLISHVTEKSVVTPQVSWKRNYYDAYQLEPNPNQVLSMYNSISDYYRTSSDSIPSHVTNRYCYDTEGSNLGADPTSPHSIYHPIYQHSPPHRFSYYSNKDSGYHNNRDNSYLCSDVSRSSDDLYYPPSFDSCPTQKQIGATSYMPLPTSSYVYRWESAPRHIYPAHLSPDDVIRRDDGPDDRTGDLSSRDYKATILPSWSEFRIL